MNEIATNLRAIDRKRLNSLYDRMQALPTGNDIWYIHTVLAQCFLPYRDPHADRWQRTNGKYSILLVSGDIRDPKSPTTFKNVGLPYGPKPRLFQSYICTQVIKQQSPVIPIDSESSPYCPKAKY